MSIKFDIVGDNKNILSALNGTKAGIRSTVKEAEQAGIDMDAIFRRIGSAAAAIGVGFSATQLVKDVARVRGEFQQLEIALGTMLGSEEKANDLFKQLVDTAAKTPFDLQGVAGGAKQLLAYGIEAENVNETLVRLGDIAAGLSIPLNDLVYLYGTTMVQGRLFTQDLRQFQGRGIPLADELAKQFGVTKDRVGELVTAGKVGFPEVEKALKAMTDEGGKFGGLMAKQSASITGQISNLEDAFDSMLNEIGKSTQGVISDSISLTTNLVENYRTVLDYLGQIVVAYGGYKAVMMATAAYNSAATKASFAIEIAELQKLIPLKEKSANEDIEAALASKQITQATAEKIMALRAEAQAHVDKLEAERIAKAYEAAEAFAAVRENQEEIESVKEKIAQLRELGKSKDADAETTKLQSLMAKQQSLAEAAETAQEIANKAATDANTASTALNTAAQNTNTTSTNILTAAKMKLAAVSKTLTATLNNPYVLAAVAVAGLAFLTYKLITAKSAEEKAIERVNKERKEEQELLDKQRAHIDEMLSIVGDETRTRNEQIKAYNELKQVLPQLTNAYSLEQLQALNTAEAQKKINEELEKAKYDNAKKDAEEYTAKLKEIEEETIKVANRTITSQAASLQQALRLRMLAQEKKDYEERLRQTSEFIKEQDELAEQAKPLDVKIKDATEARDKLKANMEKLKEMIDKEPLLATFKTHMDFEELRQKYLEAQALLDTLQAQQNEQNKPDVKNKSYWEKKKKDAENSLEALDISKKGSEKWNQYVKEIQQAQKEIEKYDTSEKDFNKKKKAAHDYQELLKRQGEDVVRQTKDNEFAVEQARIDALEEGAEKTLAQMKLNHEMEKEELKREKEDYLKAKKAAAKEAFEANPANEGKIFEGTTITLTLEEEEMFDTRQNELAKKHRREEQETNKEVLDEMLGDYRSYESKRAKINEEYAKERTKLENEIAKGNTNVNKESLDRLEKNKDNALAAVDEEFASQSEIFLAWTDTIADMSIKQLVNALDTAKAKLDELEGSGTGTEQQLAQARATIKKLEDQIKKLDAKASTDTRTIDKWKDLKDVLGDVAGEFDEVGDAIGGTVGKAISTIGSLSADTIGLINNIFEFSDMCQKGIMKTSDGAVSGIKAVESASVILAIISAAIKIITKVINLAKEAHNAHYEENIEAHQKKIDKLEDAYEDLSEKVDETFGSDRVKALKEMNENLERQNALIAKQKEDESHIKQKDEDYQKKVEEYDAAMKENIKKQEENKKAMEDAIFGEDIQSAIENFADAYAEAIEGNMSMNETAKEQAKRMMKQMVMESIKEYIAGSEKMQKIRAKMDALYADGVFSVSDQKAIIADLENFNKELDEKFGWAEGLFKDEETTTSSSSRGIATASQESVDENNGRLMSLQLSVEGIKEQMVGVVMNLSAMVSTSADSNHILSDIRQLQVTGNGFLEDIAKYTKPLNDKIGEVVEQIKRLK